MRNTLFYGDNLTVLRDREHFPNASVDLIYLDPPFNSNRSYNVLFKEESGKSSAAQIQAFDDTWHWPGAVETYHELVTQTGGKVGEMIAALHSVLGGNQMMAYLVMMAARLVELHRVLKPTGSLYLHCDPTASHYLKVVMDTIFGAQNFRSEIVWKRYSSHNDAKLTYPAVTDTILFYAKTTASAFAVQRTGYDDSYIEKHFTQVDDKGRRFSLNNLQSPNPRPNLTYPYKGYPPPPNGWKVSLPKMEELDRQGRLHFPANPNGRIRLKYFLDDLPGALVTSLWDDIQSLSHSGAERLGYPTQKPVALLERIISASSNPGDVVLDPFCGCGTTVVAAEKLGRTWIGIDITHLSTSLLKSRLLDSFGLLPKKDYDVHGEPRDLASARQLAQEDRYQFQWWAGSLIAAKPLGGSGDSKQGKKGADSGIDGTIVFFDDATEKPKRIIVQVKSGTVNRGMIGELRGTVERENAAMGVFITLDPPTQPMLNEAASAGLYTSPGWNQTYPRIQILTIADLLAGTQVKMPPSNITFKQAPRVKPDAPQQPGLGMEG